MKHYDAVIGEDGWRSASDPPDTDATVQIAWDDLSTSDEALGFYDSPSGESNRVWWFHSAGHGIHISPPGHIVAWRQKPIVGGEG